MGEEGAVPQHAAPYVDTGVIRIQDDHARRLGALEQAGTATHGMLIKIFDTTSGLPMRLDEMSKMLERHVDASEIRSKAVEEKVAALEKIQIGRSAVVNVVWGGFGHPLAKIVLFALLGAGVLAFIDRSHEASIAKAVEGATAKMRGTIGATP